MLIAHYLVDYPAFRDWGMVQTVGADRRGVGDGQGLPVALVGSEELFRLHDRTTRSLVQGCVVA
jgi:hypothetical protein